MTLVMQLPRKGQYDKSGLTCTSCRKEDCSSLLNGRCPECAEIAQAEWTKKISKRQDYSQFNMQKLVNLLLTDIWMHECEIIVDWMPKFPREDTQPICAVRWKSRPDSEGTYLRYSSGPLQGYFWDIYPDNMHSPELALLAISRVSPPVNVGKVIPTHGT